MWTDEEIRRVKLTFKSPTRSLHDMSVTFGVEGSKKTDFQTALDEFISFVVQNDGGIFKVDEVLDAETHEPCDISIFFHGGQETNAMEFKRRMPKFIGLSKWQH